VRSVTFIQNGERALGRRKITRIRTRPATFKVIPKCFTESYHRAGRRWDEELPRSIRFSDQDEFSHLRLPHANDFLRDRISSPALFYLPFQNDISQAASCAAARFRIIRTTEVGALPKNQFWPEPE
jgi:hypothetical protein